MAETDSRCVRYEVGDGFATLTLDSPHNRNAISSRLLAELTEGLRVAATDGDVRAVVLTHTGGTFCAGADLSEAAAQDRNRFGHPDQPRRRAASAVAAALTSAKLL